MPTRCRQNLYVEAVHEIELAEARLPGMMSQVSPCQLTHIVMQGATCVVMHAYHASSCRPNRYRQNQYAEAVHEIELAEARLPGMMSQVSSCILTRIVKQCTACVGMHVYQVSSCRPNRYHQNPNEEAVHEIELAEARLPGMMSQVAPCKRCKRTSIVMQIITCVVMQAYQVPSCRPIRYQIELAEARLPGMMSQVASCIC
jgi:Cu/Zn superoxide dismutase